MACGCVRQAGVAAASSGHCPLHSSPTPLLPGCHPQLHRCDPSPAKGDCIESMSCGEGRPVTSRMRSSWFMVEVPGKMGLPLINSPRMQPAARKVGRRTAGAAWVGGRMYNSQCRAALVGQQGCTQLAERCAGGGQPAAADTCLAGTGSPPHPAAAPLVLLLPYSPHAHMSTPKV